MARNRGKNEGSIYRVGNGRWRAQVSINGKRLSYQAGTRKECHDWLRKTLSQIDEGLTYNSATTTFGVFLNGWLKNKETTLAKSTAVQYHRMVEHHILPSLGDIKFKELTASKIQHFYDHMQENGAGPRTVLVVHAVIHGSLQQALKLGLIYQNPSEIVILPSEEKTEMRIWDESQVSQFLVFVKGHRNENLYYLALHTGMRQGELLGLQWRDIDFLKKTLKVLRQVYHPDKGHWEFVQPKTKAGVRTVDLGDAAVDCLRDQMVKVDLQRAFAGDRWQEYDLVFPSTVGTPQGRWEVTKTFQKSSQGAGVPRIRFHDLRHTAAALMLSHGAPVIVVSKRLGHSFLTQTCPSVRYLL